MEGGEIVEGGEVDGLTGEDGIAREELCEDAPKAPHVNRGAIWKAQDDLGGAVEARLDVGVDALVCHAAGTKVNHLGVRAGRVQQGVEWEEDA